VRQGRNHTCLLVNGPTAGNLIGQRTATRCRRTFVIEWECDQGSDVWCAPRPSSAPAFAGGTASHAPADLVAALQPVLTLVATLTQPVPVLERTLEGGGHRHPETEAVALILAELARGSVVAYSANTGPNATGRSNRFSINSDGIAFVASKPSQMGHLVVFRFADVMKCCALA
jgi:hypothetical protein